MISLALLLACATPSDPTAFEAIPVVVDPPLRAAQCDRTVTEHARFPGRVTELAPTERGLVVAWEGGLERDGQALELGADVTFLHPRDDGLWIGTDGAGLWRLTEDLELLALHGEQVVAVTETPDGPVVLTGAGTLTWIESGHARELGHSAVGLGWADGLVAVEVIGRVWIDDGEGWTRAWLPGTLRSPADPAILARVSSHDGSVVIPLPHMGVRTWPDGMTVDWPGALDQDGNALAQLEAGVGIRGPTGSTSTRCPLPGTTTRVRQIGDTVWAAADAAVFRLQTPAEDQQPE